MSRNTVILLVALCGAIAGLIIFSKLRSGSAANTAQPVASQPATETPTVAAPTRANNNASPLRPGRTTTPTPVVENQTPVAAVSSSANTQGLNAIAAANPNVPHSNLVAQALKPLTEKDLAPETKPLPVLEKDYAATTNRDERLDIMMDIAEMPGPESVKALTRLFEAEKDTDLKVDLLDSLLGIEGFKEEKLIMLTMGARQGLPTEVRQSAIDGLIDLDDARVIPVLNGLLNDPEEEIREGAKDALEMIQSQPVVKFNK